MLNLFRKSRAKVLPIKNAMRHGEKVSTGDFGLTLMYKEQVLLQIIKSKFFEQHGYESKETNSFCELNFFNKNKTNTQEFRNLFDTENNKETYFLFENPKDNFCYIKEIGSDYNNIASSISDTVKNIYKLNFEEIIIKLNY